MNNQKKWIILAVGLLVFAAIKIAMLLWWQGNQKPVQSMDCQISQMACPFGNQGASMQLVGVGDNKTPFTIRAANVPPNVREIHASFTMRDMDMGFNRFVLEKQADGVWLAQGVRLPLCTQSRHDWIMTWQVDGQHFQAAFQTRK